jgi:hypothetical protein
MAAHDNAQEPGRENERREPAEHGTAAGETGSVRLRLVLPREYERCDFESVPTKKAGCWRHTCQRCGFAIITERPKAVARCARPLPQPLSDQGPTLWQRIWNYVKAKQRWEKAGKPLRSPERVAEIYEQHCAKCPYFKDEVCNHIRCGCPVKKETLTRNKIEWATESCPLDSPKWTAEVPAND